MNYKTRIRRALSRKWSHGNIRNREDSYRENKYGVVFYLRGCRNNKYFFEDLFIRLKISILSEK